MSVRWFRSARTAWPAATAWHGLLGGPTVLTARPCGERNRRGLWRTMVLARPLDVVRAATELPGIRRLPATTARCSSAAERRSERAFLRFEVGPNTAFWGLPAPSGALGSQTTPRMATEERRPPSGRQGCRVSSLHARARVRHDAPSCRRGRDAADNRSPWMRRSPLTDDRRTLHPPHPLGGGNRGSHPIRRQRRYRPGTVRGAVNEAG
jgi:hypothetical protein